MLEVEQRPTGSEFCCGTVLALVGVVTVISGQFRLTYTLHQLFRPGTMLEGSMEPAGMDGGGDGKRSGRAESDWHDRCVPKKCDSCGIG